MLTPCRRGGAEAATVGLAKKDGKAWVGQFGKNIFTEEGKRAARAVAIDLMGSLHAAVGDPVIVVEVTMHRYPARLRELQGLADLAAFKIALGLRLPARPDAGCVAPARHFHRYRRI